MREKKAYNCRMLDREQKNMTFPNSKIYAQQYPLMIYMPEISSNALIVINHILDLRVISTAKRWRSRLSWNQ